MSIEERETTFAIGEYNISNGWVLPYKLSNVVGFVVLDRAVERSFAIATCDNIPQSETMPTQNTDLILVRNNVRLVVSEICAKLHELSICFFANAPPKTKAVTGYPPKCIR
mmetsp:Transcript_87/g.194  ORF Transcript_87/g.194 Transcript_87/m.194 type:complete len:111 (+) Transcript_87:223-555(+)